MELDDLFNSGNTVEQTVESKPIAQSGAVVVISSSLMKHIQLLLSTATIESVNTEDQFKNAVELTKSAKQNLAELDKEDAAVCDPKYSEWKAAKAVFTPQRTVLTGLIKNLSNVTARWQLEQQEKEEERVRLENQKKQAEAKRLADLADQKLRDEEALRREAQSKADAAAAETDAAKKSALEVEVNAAIAAADVAVTESIAATEAAIETEATPVFRPAAPAAKGFSASYDWTARITDEKKALKWLIENDGYGDMKGKKLTELMQSALNKIVKRKEKDFKADGAEWVKTPSAKVNAYKVDDSKRVEAV